jgi:hypothetical protein
MMTRFLYTFTVLFILSDAAILAQDARELSERENFELGIYQKDPALFGKTAALLSKNIGLLSDLLTEAGFASDQGLQKLHDRAKKLPASFEPGAFTELLNIRDSLKAVVIGNGLAQKLTEAKILTEEILVEALDSMAPEIVGQMNRPSSIESWELSIKIRDKVNANPFIHLASVLALMITFATTIATLTEKDSVEIPALNLANAEQMIAHVPKHFKFDKKMEATFHFAQDELSLARAYQSVDRNFGLAFISWLFLFGLRQNRSFTLEKTSQDLDRLIERTERFLAIHGTIAGLTSAEQAEWEFLKLSKNSSEKRATKRMKEGRVLTSLLAAVIFTPMIVNLAAFNHYRHVLNCREVISEFALGPAAVTEKPALNPVSESASAPLSNAPRQP